MSKFLHLPRYNFTYPDSVSQFDLMLVKGVLFLYHEGSFRCFMLLQTAGLRENASASPRKGSASDHLVTLLWPTPLMNPCMLSCEFLLLLCISCDFFICIFCCNLSLSLRDIKCRHKLKKLSDVVTVYRDLNVPHGAKRRQSEGDVMI